MNNIYPKFGFIVEYVNDIETAKNFYEDVLGLEVKRHHPVFVQFDTFAIAADEPMANSNEPELYWLVENAEIAFEELSQKAEICLSIEQRPFGKVFGIKTPEGRPRYLLELNQKRPSQTVESG